MGNSVLYDNHFYVTHNFVQDGGVVCARPLSPITGKMMQWSNIPCEIRAITSGVVVVVMLDYEVDPENHVPKPPPLTSRGGEGNIHLISIDFIDNGNDQRRQNTTSIRGVSDRISRRHRWGYFLIPYINIFSTVSAKFNFSKLAQLHILKNVILAKRPMQYDEMYVNVGTDYNYIELVIGGRHIFCNGTFLFGDHRCRNDTRSTLVK